MSAVPPPAPPDDKDWTWVIDRPCPECRFDASAVEPGRVAPRVAEVVAAWPAVLAGERVRERPNAETWSPLEYGCHVRDVLRVFTERVHLLLEQDNPTFPDWDQNEAAVAGRYWEQDPARVGTEIEEAGAAAHAAFAGVMDDQWDRSGMRSNGSQFTVLTLGRYFLHDLVHHLWDVTGRS